MPFTTITLHHDRIDFKWLLRGQRSLPKSAIRAIEPYRGLFSLAMVFGRAFRIVHTSMNFPDSLVIAQINAKRFSDALAAAEYPINSGG
ncbi:MAG: hypothetical protein AAF589_08475 [Planctomycetota bacterium]